MTHKRTFAYNIPNEADRDRFLDELSEHAAQLKKFVGGETMYGIHEAKLFLNPNAKNYVVVISGIEERVDLAVRYIQKSMGITLERVENLT